MSTVRNGYLFRMRKVIQHSTRLLPLQFSIDDQRAHVRFVPFQTLECLLSIIDAGGDMRYLPCAPLHDHLRQGITHLLATGAPTSDQVLHPIPLVLIQALSQDLFIPNPLTFPLLLRLRRRWTWSAADLPCHHHAGKHSVRMHRKQLTRHVRPHGKSDDMRLPDGQRIHQRDHIIRVSELLGRQRIGR